MLRTGSGGSAENDTTNNEPSCAASDSSVSDSVLGSVPEGSVPAEAVMHALMYEGSKAMTRAQANELVAQMKPDRKGMVDFEAFVGLVMQ